MNKQRVAAVLVGVFGAVAIATSSPATAEGEPSVLLGVENRATTTTTLTREDNPVIPGNHAILSLRAHDSGFQGYDGLDISWVDNGASISGRYTGVYANAPGIALQVEGPAHFSTAGKQFIPRGKSSVTFKLGYTPEYEFITRVDITEDTVVFATLRYPFVSGLFVTAAIPNAGADSVTIYLNKAAPTTVGVSYFVVNSQGTCQAVGTC